MFGKYCCRARGQGAFEYLLIIGGSVLLVSMVMMIVQGSQTHASNVITNQANNYTGLIHNYSAIPTATA